MSDEAPQTNLGAPAYENLEHQEINWDAYPGVKRRILVPVDGSEHCQRALDWFLDNIYHEGDVLVFVNVLSPDFMVRIHSSTPRLVDLDLQASVDEATQAARQLREQYKEWSAGKQVRAAFLFYLCSKPGEAIQLAAKAVEANAILIGNRGYGILRRTFLGSVTDYVIHNIRLPLMVVPPKEEQ